MPKNLNYPLASFKKSYELAIAVDELGGSCSIENCAQKLKRKVSGGFMVIISSAQKFNLIEFEKGIITISEKFKLIKYAYSDTERTELLKNAFLAPHVFSILFERFKGKEFPVNALDKILIREFGIEENVANRIAGYFIEGSKTYGLLNGSNVVAGNETLNTENDYADTQKVSQSKISSKDNHNSEESDSGTLLTNGDIGFYQIEITGPGLNSKFTLKDEDDLTILEAISKKIRNVIVNS